MSEENVAIVRGMFEAFLSGDVKEALTAFDPDVEWDGTNIPDGEISRGSDAVLRHMRAWAVELDERHSELYVVRDGRVVYRKGFSDADEALDVTGLR